MSADIDIDFADREKILSLIRHIPARVTYAGGDRPHNSGVYVTDVPRDPVLGCAAIEYQEAEKRGYFKLDFLNMSVYQLVQNQAHYDRMLAREPPWSRLWQDPEWAKKIVHIGDYHELLCKMKPDSVPRMAAFVSIIRPGKAHLQAKAWPEVFQTVWDGDGSRGFTFKRSHAFSYAVLVTLHMNLLDS